MGLPYRPPLPYGHFEFDWIRELGKGGLGYVWLIRITTSNCPGMNVGEHYACKRLHPIWNANPEARARFETEIELLKTMRHDNIVTYRGESIGGERFYIMDFFSRTLRRHIDEKNNVGNWKLVANCGVQIAEALAYAHSKSRHHRDLKPDNLLFNPAGPITIADWGLGYFIHKESKVYQTRAGMGTEYYCSVEQWANGKGMIPGDVYSLGMTLDEWVRGGQRPSMPIGAGIHAGLPDSVFPNSPGAILFNAVIRKMTMLLASQRYQSMQEVAADLRRCIDLG